MKDIVYIVGEGSPWNDNELRYSLRSLAKNMTWYQNIYVIGKIPNFLSDKVIKVPAVDVGNNKEERIKNKILIACYHPNITDDFLLMNDDYFFQAPTRADFPFYYQKELKDFFKRDGHYRSALENTVKALAARDLSACKYFDVHTPIEYNKRRFIDTMEAYDWSINEGYLIRSLYCNTQRIEGVPYIDCKVGLDCSYELLLQLVEGKPMFSIDDAAINDALFGYLDNMFPEPTEYETGTDRPQSLNSMM